MKLVELANPDHAQMQEIRERARIGGKAQCTRQYAAHENGQEIGLLVLVLCPDREFAFLYEIFVLKQFRDRGIGSRLLAAAEMFVKKKGYQRMYVDAIPLEHDYSEKDLVAWYAKYGYEPRGHRPNELAKELI